MRTLARLAVIVGLVAAGCGGSGGADNSGAGGAGGDSSTGGATGSGGSSTGGATGSGGSATGGTTGTGGVMPTGGTAGTGGAAGNSGAGGTAGASGVAGASGQAGASGVGGGAGKGGSGGGIGAGGAAAGAGGHGGTTTTGGTTGSGGGAGAPGTGGAAGATCTAPPAAGQLYGWASQPGAGYQGTSISTTTGGGNATPVTVTTLAALNSAAGGTAPAVIYVKGVLAAGTVKLGSNKTIAGICGAELHGHVDMSGSVNVIFRNLKVVGYNCSDSPSECKSGADAITIVSSAHHIWVDHCDISDGSDGNLDITNGSDFVTVSWTKFWYSTKRTDPVTGSTGHRFSNLIGAADGLAEDAGHLNITWHHDWWADNVAERMPRSRDGKIHVVNNLFTAAGNDYCSNSGNLSSLLVENNVYIGVANPLQEDADGNMLSRNNVFTSTTGSKTSGGTGFTPPYTLTPDATGNLEATIRAQAGPR
jgi:pectate lyase